MVLIVNKGKSISVINKAEIKFPPAGTGRDILFERQFLSFKQDGIQLLLLPYIPNRNSNFVFGYNNRMLLIQEAYKRQKTGHTGGCFDNGIAGPIRFICRIMCIRILLGGSIVPKRITDGCANVLLHRFASSMIRASGAIGKSLIVLKHKPNYHNFFKTGFVASVF